MRDKIHASLFRAMPDLRKNLARRLQETRGEKTLRAFAAELGIHHAHLHRIEQCSENITLDTIERLTKRLRCSVGWLFDDP